MCEETFFSFALLFKRSVRGTADFCGALRLCPETVEWKTAPPTDSLGPMRLLQELQRSVRFKSLEFHNWLKKCENRHCQRDSPHPKFETGCFHGELASNSDLRQLCGSPARNTVWSLPPGSSLPPPPPPSFFCPVRFRPCVFARMISFQDTRGFIVLLKACGQRITSKSIQDE